MPASGYMLRRDQAFAARGELPCGGCSHPIRRHREHAPSTWAMEDGELVEVPNPDYEPFVSHCEVEGCDCVVDRSGGA